MSELDGVYTWIFLLFKATPEESVKIKELVNIINDIFNKEQLESIQNRLNEIKNLSDNEFTIDHYISIASALKDIVNIIEPIFKKLKNVISTDEINHLNDNLSTFIQILIMVSLYQYRYEINGSAIVDILPILSDIAIVSIKIKQSGKISKFFKSVKDLLTCSK